MARLLHWRGRALRVPAFLRWHVPCVCTQVDLVTVCGLTLCVCPFFVTLDNGVILLRRSNSSSPEEVNVMPRRVVNKRRSAAGFRRQIGRTKAVNLARPGRGGFRL